MMSGPALDAIFIRLDRRSVYIPRPPPSEQLGLLYVATAAATAGFNVEVFDSPALTLDGLIEQIGIARPNLVGFYVDHENVHATISLGQRIKEHCSTTKLVAGGPQAREWDERIVDAGFDVAVRCEGEQVIESLIRWSRGDREDLSDMRGVTWASNGRTLRNLDAPAIDLDQLPIPDRLLNLEHKTPSGTESIITGRGCPFRCTFCYEGRPEAKYRARSLDNVLAELEFLVTKRAARYISVLDDVFTLNAKRVIAFAEGVKDIKRRTGADFVWFCEARADIIVKRPDMVHACVDAGLVRMQIGMETGSQVVLDAYNKQLQVEDTARAVEICRDADVLSMIGNFIVGGAWETHETAEITRDFAANLIELAPGRVDITSTLFTPYPGTPMHDHPDRFGLEVLDPDCVTGPGDNYPFARTEALSQWDIVELRQKLIHRVDESMKKHGRSVPTELGDRHFRAYHYYGLRTNWFDHFCQNFASYNYFGMPAASVDILRMHDVTSDKLLDLKPIRTVVLGTTIDGSFIVDTGYERLQLGRVSGALYELCAGKLRLREIVRTLKKRSLLETASEAVDLLATFDANRLVVFSKY
ncbi:radical SAM protein [Bradyrhizobium sp. CB2312]|uniref:B12-binding domain-containing radical SAM protein n=1 Tax=Bradyrhizobium sp. CB2312 TaxID=3039155 RepID=UPI0024B06A22|nr:radical SAM protein [Bradyrhizobium sp. CB2312]WFU76644.1 radical SAM protein [Bradyrhizobium sp. CB2312]